MKLFIFSFAAIVLLQSVTCQSVAPTKCEDVLPENTCIRLRDIASKFNEKAGIVNQAIIDAYNHHKTRAAEVLSYVKESIVAKAANFKCEDFITADNCAKVTDVATKLHLTATQASLALKEAIINGATKATDIYNNAVVYMRDRLSQLNCESLLKADQCTKLKDFAALIHVKATEVNKAIREAVIEGAANAKDQFAKAMDFLKTEVTCDKILGENSCDKLRTAATSLKESTSAVHEAVMEALNKHLTKASEIFKSIQETLVTKATNFKCSDVMPQDKCDKIVSIGQHLKLKSSEISTAIKEGVVNSAAKAQEIYGRAIGFLLNDVKNLKCEDLVSAETCAAVAENAKKFHAKATDVALAVKEAIVNGATNAKDYIKQATEYLKAKTSCDNVLSVESCDKIRNMADKFHVSLSKVDDFLRLSISNGVTKVSDLYKSAMEWIVEKWMGVFGDEPSMYKRGIMDKIDEYQQKIKEKVKAIAMKILSHMKDIDEKARVYIKNAIDTGKITILNVKQKIKELLAQLKSTDASDEAMSIYRRSIKDTLTEALKNVHGKTKEWIKELLTKSSERLEKMKAWIKKKLETDGITTRGDELEADFELVKHIVEQATEAMFDEMKSDAVQQMHESFNDNSESLNHKVIAMLEKYVVDKAFTEKHRVAIDKWVEEHASYIEWAMGMGESYVVKIIAEAVKASFFG